MLYREIAHCRICRNTQFETIIDLGMLALTGVFPMPGEEVEKGPLVLVKCGNKEDGSSCGLVQLKHDYDLTQLYGDNYGYRSGLNKSMVSHLHTIVQEVQQKVSLESGDLIIDIASNDGTLLSGYSSEKNLLLLGVDPTAEKFKQYYPAHISFIADFFSAKNVQGFTQQKAKVITSIAMFYDLEEPIEFMRQIKEVLHDEGVWIFEQSYMPLMVERVAYDTICHEHLEYYAVKQIEWMVKKAGLKIVDISFNDINGGSFCITAAKQESRISENKELVARLLEEEQRKGYDGTEVYENFSHHVYEHKEKLIAFLDKVKQEGKKIYGYGASTKGNVILQYCGITAEDIPCIAEVNDYKFGRETPGTHIPIISEVEARLQSPDYFMVLPWHFKDNIIERERVYLQSGGHLFFPLPVFEIV